MNKLILLIATVMCSFTAYGQISLEVSVANPQNNTAVPAVTVTVSRAAIGFERSQTANAQGKARFQLPLPGDYTVSIAEGSEYNQLAPATVNARSNEAASIVVLALPIAQQELQNVTITSNYYSPTRLNTINAEVSSELNAKELEDIPLEGRDITRVLYRLPNVSRATGFFPEAPNVAINGANSLFTNYLIDGMDNNENFLGGQRFAVPLGLVENINVLTNNYSSEFGLTANGIINITTKSGTNTLSGEGYYTVRPGSVLDAEREFPLLDLSGNQVKEGFQRHQFGFALGGPIVKDKTFFYINAEQTIDTKDNVLTSPSLNVQETVQGTNNFTYLSGKVDHFWNSRMHTALRVNAGIVAIERQGGGLEGGATFPSAGNAQDRNSVMVALQNTYQATDFTLETNYQYGRFRWNYANPENPNSPNVTVLGPDETTIAILGHPGFVFDNTENTHQFKQKLTFYKGNHTFKAGVELKSSNFQLAGGGNPNGSYTVRLTDAQLTGLAAHNLGAGLAVTDIPSDVEVLFYGVELRPAAFGATQNIFSAYIEDQFSVVDRLNLTLGLRYDYDNLSKGGGTQGDANNIAPRLTANYRLSSNSSLRFGYGIYFEKVLYAIYSDALQQNTTSADYQTQLRELQRLGLLPASADINGITHDGNLGASAPATYLQGPSAESLQGQRSQAFSNERRILNPNGYDNPFSHQFTLGYQKQLNSKMLFYVDLMHNRSFNLFRLRNLNAPAAYPVTDPNNVVVRTAEEADLARPIPIMTDAQGSYALINGQRVNGVARNIVISESGGQSRYWAANFTLNKDRATDWYSFRLNYTLSFLENNTEDINFRAMDANNFEAEWGPSINDRRHIINGLFTAYMGNRFSVTLASLLQSGQPINRIPDATIYGTTDLNGDGRAFSDAYQGNSDRHPGESRNSDRLPWAETFDLSLQYRLPMGTNTLTIGANVFNVTNNENLSGYSNNATQSNQIQVGAAGTGIVRRNADAPRQFQFNLRYQF